MALTFDIFGEDERLHKLQSNCVVITEYDEEVLYDPN